VELNKQLHSNIRDIQKRQHLL